MGGEFRPHSDSAPPTALPRETCPDLKGLGDIIGPSRLVPSPPTAVPGNPRPRRPPTHSAQRPLRLEEMQPQKKYKTVIAALRRQPNLQHNTTTTARHMTRQLRGTSAASLQALIHAGRARNSTRRSSNGCGCKPGEENICIYEGESAYMCVSVGLEAQANLIERKNSCGG